MGPHEPPAPARHQETMGNGMSTSPYTGPSMPVVKLQYHTTALVPEDEVWAWLDDGWTRMDDSHD